MVNFINWLEEEAIKKKRKKNGEQHGNQGSGKIGNVDHQGQVDRSNQEVHSNNIHAFPEP